MAEKTAPPTILVGTGPVKKKVARAEAKNKVQNYFLRLENQLIKLDKRKNYKLGRDEKCEIQLDNQHISRQHGNVKWSSTFQTFVFLDLNSRNGSTVNGQAVTKKQLKPGDVIEIVDQKIQFEARDVASQSPKVADEPELPRETVLLEQKFNTIMRSVDNTNLLNKLKDYHAIVVESRKNLSLLAYYDQLTGLFNRRFYDLNLEREIKTAQRQKSQVALIMIDIDHFKKFNDTYGHQKGDEVLEGVSGIIRSRIRETDFACRYGGEELVVILPNTTTAEAQKVAEKIRRSVAELSPIQFDVQVTISLGVAGSSLLLNTPDLLFKAADKAVYQAKECGRNRVMTAHKV
ncbi:GGDEF domain-containing protein [candidate division KSB1 bacterium]|nr:GGDEF domain-containing protein [candidate division KSB1 bacterium]